MSCIILSFLNYIYDYSESIKKKKRLDNSRANESIKKDGFFSVGQT